MIRLLLDSVRIALHDMLKKPFRTFLVLQGMIWGAAAAIMPPAVIDGSRKAMLERASQLGTDRVVITADTMDEAGALTRGDAEFLERTHGASITALAPLRARRALFRYRNRISAGWVVGTTPSEVVARTLTLQGGRFFRTGENEAVLEPGTAEELEWTGSEAGSTLEVFLLPPGGDNASAEDPEGLAAGDDEEAKLREAVESGAREPDLPPLEAVGLLAPIPPERKDVNDFGVKRNHFLSGLAEDLMTNMGVEVHVEPWREEGRTLHVPLDLLEDEEGRIDMIVLRAKPEAVVDLIRELQSGLSSRGRTPLIRWNLLAPVILKGGMDRYTRLRYATFALCLVMGMIVISNVMLFYVLESYREIAVRRVEGATKADVALQFLAYATLLSVTGGLLGLPIGMFVAQVRIWLAPQAALALTFPWGSAAVVVGCTVAAGVVAGVLPAYRAVSLDPVKALRHE